MGGKKCPNFEKTCTLKIPSKVQPFLKSNNNFKFYYDITITPTFLFRIKSAYFLCIPACGIHHPSFTFTILLLINIFLFYFFNRHLFLFLSRTYSSTHTRTRCISIYLMIPRYRAAMQLAEHSRMHDPRVWTQVW